MVNDEVLSASAVLGALYCEEDSGNGLTSFSDAFIEKQVRHYFPELAAKIIQMKQLENETSQLLENLWNDHQE